MTSNRMPKDAKAARSAFDLDEYLPYLINRTGATVAGAFTDELAPAKITLPMWRILAALHHHGEQRQIDLSQFTSIEESSVSRLVTALVRKGLVARRRSTRSQREVNVALSAKGRALTLRYIPVALAYEAVGTEGLSAGDLATLRRCLTHIFRNLEAWIAAQKTADTARARRRAA